MYQPNGDQPGQPYYEDVPSPIHTQPYQTPAPASVRLAPPTPAPATATRPGLLVAAVLFAVAAFGLASWQFYQQGIAKTGSAHQISQLSSQLASQGRQLASDGKQISGLRQALSDAQAQSAKDRQQLASLKGQAAQYSLTCTQPLSAGTGGAAIYRFPCGR